MGENRVGHFYRHLGVYGICVNSERILVIQKILGPYLGKFDLPGGRLDELESLEQAIIREIQEETGYDIYHINNIGVCDFSVMWTLKDGSDELLHHIAILYEVKVNTDKVVGKVKSFEGQDSNGAKWIPLTELCPENSSPLVLKAVDWVKTRTIAVERDLFDFRN